MKKNNPIIIGTLAVVVLLIWGIIIYQSFDYFFVEEETEIVDFDNNGMTKEMNLLIENQVPFPVQYLTLKNDPFRFQKKKIVINPPEGLLDVAL